MANPPPSHYRDIGELGEDLVAKWLESTGWVILYRRFSCRWGEIDIIAQYDGVSGPDNNSQSCTQYPTLAFVEVKTRSSRNWDAGGRSAITPQKQAKICNTAQIFLADYPHKADYPCRFDVAIVYCQKLSKNHRSVKFIQEALASSLVAGYEFQLQEYIPAAFDFVDPNA
ncbi:MAG: YraN family protein [Gloeotrichia echinulata GP01]